MMRWLACLLVSGGIFALGCAPLGIASDVPLQDRPVPAPAAEVPKELAAFAGRWVGVWTDGRSYRKNMALIVERLVPPDRAIGFYGCGHAMPIANPVCPSSFEFAGRLEAGILKIPYPAIGAQGRFRINGAALEGELVDANTGKLLIWVKAARLP
jgi:hypothetical protein